MQVPPLIELIGVPGSGKTTIGDILERELESLGVSPLTLPDKGRAVARRSRLGAMLPGASFPWADRVAWKLFEFERLSRGLVLLFRRPALSVDLITRQLVRPRAARRRRRVIHWWIRAAGARSLLLARRREGEVVVLDEGLCHRVVQLFSSAQEVPDSTAIARYAAGIPRPDVLIHVVAPLDVCRRRVLDRGLWERMAGEGEDQLSEYLSHAEQAIFELLHSEEIGGVRVVAVDNPGPEIPTGSEIVERLRAAGVLA